MSAGLTPAQGLTAADALIEYGVTHVRDRACDRAIDVLRAIDCDSSADALARYRDSVRELFSDEDSDVVRRISDYSVRA